ncbi:rhodanese-related sulfurtransferase [Williamsia sp. CHRR-6]|uniref:oxygen-dependent tRNA uridine(34) hydroxylase TrhO n=1 Tax=Williamsia sp. CHRR-6 TaxID=2835871 RepID=UPI001BD9BA18|nr:rhodanese-related sulfurtransferase [Williamsia sp. CHRR-6]MBT0565579.1 rhodanese-related sulfurtransferase [Williamsia sp. CHRR-6]
MTQSKIALFYVFTPLADPEAIRLWQQVLAESSGLRGRIIVASHGINAAVGGPIAAVKRYVSATRGYAPFGNADVKWSDGGADDFPRLQVRVRPEIVSFGVPGVVDVDAGGVVGGGIRLAPDELHRLLDERGDEVVMFDGRNAIESRLGHFQGAVRPDVTTTREFVDLLDGGAFDDLKGRPVVTYCTGGVRCEVLSALMVRRGFSEVYQLDGGIMNYGKRFGDRGRWRGAMYVFDRRMSTTFSDNAAVISTCDRCATPSTRVINLPKDRGRALTVRCQRCDDGPA